MIEQVSLSILETLDQLEHLRRHETCVCVRHHGWDHQFLLRLLRKKIELLKGLQGSKLALRQCWSGPEQG